MTTIVSSASVRRSRFLISYWKNGVHRVYNYATRVTYPESPLVSAILALASSWTSRKTARKALSQWDHAVIDRTIDDLVTHSVLDAADRPPPDSERALQRWEKWHPAAAFFHRATRGFSPTDADGARIRNERILVERDYPPATKEYRDRPHIKLPIASVEGQFAEVLLQRRSWREFGTRDITLEEIATLLALTFGVQRWMDLGDDRWVALKTSPSGGARHSIEAYLLAFRIAGLENGTYHYCPDRHALTLLPASTPQALLADFMPTQTGFHDAAALVVMSSVFARVQWKYEFPRAYRVVLMDAGHLGQTFALTATSLGLAPFCTAALDDPLIEEHLGIDGVDESVLFAVGVGPKPADKAWAPMHDGSPSPSVKRPQWAEDSAGREHP